MTFGWGTDNFLALPLGLHVREQQFTIIILCFFVTMVWGGEEKRLEEEEDE